MAVKTIKTQDFNWYYLTDFSNEELAFLKNNFKFHPLDLKDCGGEIQRSKIDLYRNYLFLVLQLPALDTVRKKVVINQVYFFIGKNYLVSITREKFKPINNFFYKIINNKFFREESFSKGSGYLLYKILDIMLRQSWLVHGYLDQEIKQIETEIDEGHGKRIVFNIASLRRIILRLKAIVDPQRLVTNALSKLDVSFLTKEMAIYFDDLDDFIEKNIFILEGYRDRILTLHEINESLISYRTNKVMKILTVFSVALLPLTLLSGIYGMNINLPFSHSPDVILLFFGGLLLIIVGIFLILKKIDWI